MLKLKSQFILRAMTPAGESTSLGNLPFFASKEKALEAVAKGDVTLPNGCAAHVVEAHVPVAEGEADDESAAAKKPAAPKKSAAPKAPAKPNDPPKGEGTGGEGN
jgi:hypothetical protein